MPWPPVQGENRLETRVTALRERTLELADAFLKDVRHDLAAATVQRFDLAPRIRTMHTRPGHATPEYRTLAIPSPPTGETSTTFLSLAIAHYARMKSPCAIVLAFEATLEGGEEGPGTVLIAEARDRWGTRLFYIQPYRTREDRLAWGEPVGGGWRDPGEEEMILDSAFGPVQDEHAELEAPPAPAAE
jgi:hypothetical protein